MKKLGILVSGRGSNMAAIIDACKQGNLSASVEIVISNNPDAEALVIAKGKKINTICFDKSVSENLELLDKSICNVLHDYNVELVLLAGYMKMVGPMILSMFGDKILNVHPSLLPKYGGHGMYGINVHRAVINAGEEKSGATVHLVNKHYDKGKILAQKSVIVEDDTPETLAKKVLKIEHLLYVETVKKIIEGKITL
tara:strand:- start:105 stop:695 length:591 start_codon:yes stop_codon:yes gene_type:complete